MKTRRYWISLHGDLMEVLAMEFPCPDGCAVDHSVVAEMLGLALFARLMAVVLS